MKTKYKCEDCGIEIEFNKKDIKLMSYNCEHYGIPSYEEIKWADGGKEINQRIETYNKKRKFSFFCNNKDYFNEEDYKYDNLENIYPYKIINEKITLLILECPICLKKNTIKEISRTKLGERGYIFKKTTQSVAFPPSDELKNTEFKLEKRGEYANKKIL